MKNLILEIYDFIRKNEDIQMIVEKDAIFLDFKDHFETARDEKELTESFQKIKRKIATQTSDLEEIDIDNVTVVKYKKCYCQPEPEYNIKGGWDIDIYRVTVYSEALDKEIEIKTYDEEKIKQLIIKDLEQ